MKKQLFVKRETHFNSPVNHANQKNQKLAFREDFPRISALFQQKRGSCAGKVF